MRKLSKSVKSILQLSGALEFLLIVMIGTALYFQHHYGLEPCEACIQIRLMVLGMLCVLQFMPLPSFHIRMGILTVISALNIWMLERTIYLIKLESGDGGNGSCNFNQLFPDWLPLDQWVPGLFEVRAMCGDSTEMFAGISMPEAILPAIVLIQVLVLGIGVLVYKNKKGS